MDQISENFDVVVSNGLYFDGTGAEARICDIGIKDGKIKRISSGGSLITQNSKKTLNAEGHWIMPGFLDTHTHYDAELIATPSLSESVRHGVTTALVGSCSLSMVCSDVEDASDIFTRVETVPREKVLPILKKNKTWSTPKEWKGFVQKQALGPNIISFIGHSDLRTAAMGLSRATDINTVPTESEIKWMEAMLQEAIDEGFLGLSSMCLTWDKVDGDREWSKCLPSTYAKWGEISRLNKLLRKHGRVHQGAPNAAKPYQIFQYLMETVGLIRKPLKTTLISLIDLRGSPSLRPLSQLMAKLINWLDGNLRWQLLPTPFTVYADGIDIIFFEEFGAGEMALDLKDQVERNELLKDEAYRRKFRKFYGEKLSPRVWQRDFGDAIILECPDESIVGKNFDEVARARNIHVVDLFLDLVVEYGRQLRWYTTVGNHRTDVLAKMVQDKNTLITFSDAGAHIRNMAFYNLPLRFLKMVYQSHLSGNPIMSLEKAVWRMTGEQADWLNVQAGRIREGDRADLVIINPKGFDQDLEKVHWGKMENFGLDRLVNRNPGLVKHVFINGRPAVENEQISSDLGYSRDFGKFLPAI